MPVLLGKVLPPQPVAEERPHPDSADAVSGALSTLRGTADGELHGGGTCHLVEGGVRAGAAAGGAETCIGANEEVGIWRPWQQIRTWIVTARSIPRGWHRARGWRRRSRGRCPAGADARRPCA